MRIRLRIDSLLLETSDGGPHQAAALRHAIVRELSSRLAAPQEFASFEQPGVSVAVPPLAGSTADRVGAGIGAAVHGSLRAHAE